MYLLISFLEIEFRYYHAHRIYIATKVTVRKKLENQEALYCRGILHSPYAQYLPVYEDRRLIDIENQLSSYGIANILCFPCQKLLTSDYAP